MMKGCTEKDGFCQNPGLYHEAWHHRWTDLPWYQKKNAISHSLALPIGCVVSNAHRIHTADMWDEGQPHSGAVLFCVAFAVAVGSPRMHLSYPGRAAGRWTQLTLSFISFCTSSGNVLPVPRLSMFGPTQMARLLASILLVSAFWLMRWSTESNCLSKTRFGLGNLSATLSEKRQNEMLIPGAVAATSLFEQVSVAHGQTALPPEKGMPMLSLLCRSVIQKSPTATELVGKYKILNYVVLTEGKHYSILCHWAEEAASENITRGS